MMRFFCINITFSSHREEELNTSLKQLRSELAAAQQNNDILQSQLLSIESRYGKCLYLYFFVVYALRKN